MSKERNPFVNYSVEEVFASEAITYVIQAGHDVFNVDGRWVFNKRSAAIYYNKILRELLSQISKGSQREKDYARKVLANLKIHPLRVH